MEKKQKKRLTKLWVLRMWLISLVGGLGFLIYYGRPYKVTKKIWLPQNYEIINKMGDEYVPFPKVSVSGTASFMPFEKFRENFANKKNNIYTQADGRVYYIVKEDGETFVAEVDYTKNEKSLIAGDNLLWVDSIIDDSRMTLYCGCRLRQILLFSLIFFVISGVTALFLYCFLEERIEKV